MIPEDLARRMKTEGRVSLTLRVQPRSPRSEWAGLLADGSYKLRVAAVPEKGKANEEIVRFLAGEFGVPRAQVEIVAGTSGQRKQVRITRAPGAPR